MLDVINQNREQTQRDEKDFGIGINELIMRQTKAKLAVFRTRMCGTMYMLTSTTSHKAHVEDPKR
jgi:hypothetical protein